MTVVDLNLDEEILSQHEKQPQAPKAPPVNPSSAQCHFCVETFEGPVRYFTRGRHEKSQHQKEWEAAKVPGAKKSARTRKATKKPPATKRPGGTPTTKRVSGADALGENIARAARVFAGVNGPMARALVFSAPATGQAIDEVVAGTIVDRVAIQPFAKLADKWNRLEGVLAFPILFAIVSTKPETYDALEGELRDSLLDVIIASIPSLVKRKQRESDAVAALVKLGEVDPRYANTPDPVGLILRDLLYGFPEAGGDVPTE